MMRSPHYVGETGGGPEGPSERATNGDELKNQTPKPTKNAGKNKRQRSENIFRPRDGVGGRRGPESYHREGSRWPANLLLAALYREQFDA